MQQQILVHINKKQRLPKYFNCQYNQYWQLVCVDVVNTKLLFTTEKQPENMEII